MRNFWTLFSILLLAILATARFAESAAVTALLHPPYGARLLSAVGILTAGGLAPCLSASIGWCGNYTGTAICGAGAAARRPR